jgi:hypothetical protein
MYGTLAILIHNIISNVVSVNVAVKAKPTISTPVVYISKVIQRFLHLRLLTSKIKTLLLSSIFHFPSNSIAVINLIFYRDYIRLFAPRVICTTCHLHHVSFAPRVICTTYYLHYICHLHDICHIFKLLYFINKIACK